MSRRQSPINAAGLSGLLGAASELAQAPAAETALRLEQLHPGSGQPRREFNPEKLQELARSIREKGVIQPLLVRPVEEGYEIVVGERRWRAAKLAGLTEVPVLIRELTDSEARHLALIENVQRENLNMVDEVDAKLALTAYALGLSPQGARARLMQLLREERGPDHEILEELFSTLGENWVTFAKSKLRVLNWPPEILEAVRDGLPYTLAGVIVTAPAEHHRRLLARAREGASREELRGEVQRLRAGQDKGLAGGRTVSDLARLGRTLGSRKWASRLSPQEQQELEDWLAQMPPALRRTLED